MIHKCIINIFIDKFKILKKYKHLVLKISDEQIRGVFDDCVKNI
jgi:hypothetical protein